MTIIDWLQTGIGVIIDGAILMAIIPIAAVVLILNNSNARTQQVNQQIEKYTEFNQYDGTHVKPQDITAAVLTYRGFPAVAVQKSDGTNAVWSTTRKDTEYTAVDVNTVINQNTVYDADIEMNPNGEIITVIFKPCSGNCGR